MLESNIPRGMESTTERVAYKLLRNESSLLDNETFHESVREQVCSHQKRQYKCCPIYQSPGRAKINQSLSFNLGIMADGHSEQDSFEGSTYNRQEKCVGRSIKSNKNTTIRMDIEQDNCQSNISSLGYSSDRSICVLGEQTHKDFLYMDSSSQCTSFGYINNSMGEHVCLCVPSNLSDSKDIKIHEAVPLSDYLNSTSVATETMVSGHSTVIDSSSYQTSTMGEFIDLAQNPNLPSKSSNVEFSCMAPLDRNFKAEGFSESARNLLNASWRKGTRKDYITKYEKPPKVNLLPEWDLQMVLKTLENEPFEPLSDASLKFVTFKTVFLIAITTFRRCSDFQSLRIDKESMRVQDKGITFIRHGLSKQDRQSHFGTKIHVPHFTEREFLDPKRSITIYLDKTKEIRQKLDASDKVELFLALKEPHKPVTAVTISSLIVQTIRSAYSNDKLKVKGHSTRAIAPSWALYT
ncbi:unnamed protein product [Mytilus coruscus]|uniref:Tyr recombinase domain-containing protein n=1 Tax=Mytilus coruscus TaxID=42192 RepID=A0A6J8DH99_MYTCO|nr:unnamed protein product [Mytilus coruscus]